ncbi:DNA methyltransferase family protein [Salininema proteolyticum]|uniref:Uncharacterized protein n=1 Tax=Salininema proteolyticum TaxID=1607685 RepID=A0ABV8TYS4_9ACTN
MAVVTLGDIARLAEVNASAVSNWKSRDPGFPRPVDAEGRYFDLGQVEQWAASEGRAFLVSPADRVWFGLAERFPTADEALGYAASQLVMPEPDDDVIADLVVSEDRSVVLEGFAVRAGAAPESDFADRVRSLLAMSLAIRDEPGASGERDGVTGSGTGALPGGGGAPGRPGAGAEGGPGGERAGREGDGAEPLSAYDPAAARGDLLLACAEQPGVGSVTGTEPDPSKAATAHARLALLHPGVRESVTTEEALVGPPPSDPFDLVVCDAYSAARAQVTVPPSASDARGVYGRPPKTEPEMSWLVHCATVAKRGGLVLVRMPNAASHRRSGRRIRAELIRQGALRAVVSNPDGRTQTWVLRPQAPSNGQVVLSDGDLGEGVPVSAIELLDEAVDVTPDLYLSRDAGGPADVVAELGGLEGRLREAAESVPHWRVTEGQTHPGVSLETLEKDGAVSISQETEGRGIALEPRSLRILSLGTLEPQSTPVWLITVTGGWDADWIAACLHHHRPGTSGTSEGKRRILGVKVPRLSYDEQRYRGAAFREVWELRKRLAALSRECAALADGTAAMVQNCSVEWE